MNFAIPNYGAGTARMGRYSADLNRQNELLAQQRQQKLADLQAEYQQDMQKQEFAAQQNANAEKERWGRLEATQDYGLLREQYRQNKLGERTDKTLAEAEKVRRSKIPRTKREEVGGEYREITYDPETDTYTPGEWKPTVTTKISGRRTDISEEKANKPVKTSPVISKIESNFKSFSNLIRTKNQPPTKQDAEDEAARRVKLYQTQFSEAGIEDETYIDEMIDRLQKDIDEEYGD